MAMNNPEVTMHEPATTTRFETLDKAVAAAGLAISLVRQVSVPLRPLANQVIRSASSVPANLAEGSGRGGRDRHYHFRIAYGSAKEVDIHLQLLVSAGGVEASAAEPALRLIDDVRAMIWRLIHPKP
jgi:four helix bundle protein